MRYKFFELVRVFFHLGSLVVYFRKLFYKEQDVGHLMALEEMVTFVFFILNRFVCISEGFFIINKRCRN